MKTRHPLANGKALPMLWFRTIGLERLPRAALGPATTRKRAQSSLKIEGLRRTHFRAPRSAATLKPYQLSYLCKALYEFPRSSERGHIEAIFASMG